MIAAEGSNGQGGAVAGAEGFDLRTPLLRLGVAVRQHRLLVLGTCLASIGLVVAWIQFRPPEYEAEVMLLSEPRDDIMRDRFYDQWNLFRKNEPESEVELITGPTVLLAVMSDLGLGWDDVYHPLGSQIRRWWMTCDLGNWYRDQKARWFPVKKSADALTPEERERIEVLKDLKTGMRFEAEEGTHVGRIVVRGPSPRVSDVANAVARTFLAQRTSQRESEADAAVQALSGRVDDARRRITEIEAELERYREAHGIVFDFEREKSATTLLTRAQSELLDRQATLARTERELEVLDTLIGAESEEYTSQRVSELNAIKQHMKTEMHQLEMALVDKRQRFRPDAPEIAETEALLVPLREKLAAAEEMVTSSEARTRNTVREAMRKMRLETEVKAEGLRKEIGVLETSIAGYDRGLEGLSGRQRFVQGRIRDLSHATAEYGVLLEKQVQAQVSKATAGATRQSIRVVENAVPPGDPAWPNTKILISAAALFGLVIGVALAWLVEIIQGRVQVFHVGRGRGAGRLWSEIRLPSGDPAWFRAGHGAGSVRGDR